MLIRFPPLREMLPRMRKTARKSTGPIGVPRHQLAPRHENSSNGSNDPIGDLEAQVEQLRSELRHRNVLWVADGERIIDAQRSDEKIEAGKANCFRRDDQGVVWFNNCIVVPKNDEIRQQILDEAHLSCYYILPGSTKMYHDLKRHYWWTKMKIEIARYVARCDTCKRVKAIHMKADGPLQSLHIPTWKWEDISMDFIVGLPRTAKGYDSIWVIVDRLTKIAHFLPVRVKYTAATYAELYIARILSLHGVPKTIVSDCGPQFVSKFWEELHKALDTKWLHSSAYHPQTSGQTERVNQILEDMLRACALEFSQKWDDCLPLAEFSYNNSYQESIKMAPFEALYGRRCRTPLN
jgi:hypothetical protein